MTSTGWFWFAAALSVAMAWGHVVVAGRFVVRPLLDDAALSPQVRWLAYFCWHVVTVLAVGMAFGFAVVALDVAPFALAVHLCAVALCCAALGFAVAVRGSLSLRSFPPPLIFLFVSVVAMVGVLTHR